MIIKSGKQEIRLSEKQARELYYHLQNKFCTPPGTVFREYPPVYYPNGTPSPIEYLYETTCDDIGNGLSLTLGLNPGKNNSLRGDSFESPARGQGETF